MYQSPSDSAPKQGHAFFSPNNNPGVPQNRPATMHEIRSHLNTSLCALQSLSLSNNTHPRQPQKRPINMNAGGQIYDPPAPKQHCVYGPASSPLVYPQPISHQRPVHTTMIPTQAAQTNSSPSVSTTSMHPYTAHASALCPTYTMVTPPENQIPPHNWMRASQPVPFSHVQNEQQQNQASSTSQVKLVAPKSRRSVSKTSGNRIKNCTQDLKRKAKPENILNSAVKMEKSESVINESFHGTIVLADTKRSSEMNGGNGDAEMTLVEKGRSKQGSSSSYSSMEHTSLSPLQSMCMELEVDSTQDLLSNTQDGRRTSKQSRLKIKEIFSSDSESDDDGSGSESGDSDTDSDCAMVSGSITYNHIPKSLFKTQSTKKLRPDEELLVSQFFTAKKVPVGVSSLYGILLSCKECNFISEDCELCRRHISLHH